MKKRVLMMAAVVAAMISCTDQQQVDVLVVGGGASGVAAAVQSARMGTQTMILEEGPWLGGMLTSAGVSCVDGNYNMRSGIFGEFLDSLAAHYGGYEALKTGWVSHVCFEPQVGQNIFTSMTEALADKLVVERNAKVKKVQNEDGDWLVNYTDAKGRKYQVLADVLIDATELGDIAAQCGVEYRLGMDSSADTGEHIAPAQANDVIQDLTYVAVLKDYGPDADMTIPEPAAYDPDLYVDCCLNSLNTTKEKTLEGQILRPAEQMLSYGKLPGGKYMINWPVHGNDTYLNIVEMSPRERKEALEKAKSVTLGFLYFIQTQLGMKNLGLADDVFPSEDGLALMPYHRESRRIKGEAFFTMDAAARPYDYDFPYYRTGVAVGDYAVDHHHFRYPQWNTLPDLHFYPIPSFNVPMGSLIPQGAEDLLVVEKSISVSNLMNGATRLQPVVMQLGQAAGVIASYSTKTSAHVRNVGVRKVQQALLDAGCYIMPYLDLPKEHPHFKTIQRIGAVGILHGEGRNVGWTNQTWFRINDPLRTEDIFLSDIYSESLPLPPGEISIGTFMAVMRTFGFGLPSDPTEWWERLGLQSYQESRTITRLEASVLIDELINPFRMFEINIKGEILNAF